MAGVAKSSVRNGFCICQVWFDVIDGSAIEEIQTSHLQLRGIEAVYFHTFQSHQRQTQAIRTVGGTAGKDTYPLVSSQSGRTHCRLPAPLHRLMKTKDEPYVREILQSAQCLNLIVAFLKDYLTPGAGTQAGLPWNSKLTAETGANKSNGFDLHESMMARKKPREQ